MTVGQRFQVRASGTVFEVIHVTPRHAVVENVTGPARPRRILLTDLRTSSRYTPVKETTQ